MGKGEIAHNNQFHFFPRSVFYPPRELFNLIFVKCKVVVCRKSLSLEESKIWYSVKVKPFVTHSRLLTTLTKKAFENIVGKEGNAGNQHFLLSPQSFLPYQGQIKIFERYSILLTGNAFILVGSSISSKILS